MLSTLVTSSISTQLILLVTLGSRTWVIDLVTSIAEDLEGSTELLSSKGRVKGKENLNHRYGLVGLLNNRTHCDGLFIKG